jgi:hypothetical protein
MERHNIHLEKLILVGLTVRTNNKNEMNPSTSKIAVLSNLYWSDQMADRI